MFKRKQKRDVRAVAEAEKMRFPDLMRVEKLRKVAGEALKRKSPRPAGRRAVTAGIYGDDPVPCGKIFDLSLKICAVLSVTVEQDEHVSIAFFRIVKLYVHSHRAAVSPHSVSFLPI